MKLTHDFIERNSWLMIILNRGWSSRRRAGRDRPAVLPAPDDPAVAGIKPYEPLRLVGRDVLHP